MWYDYCTIINTRESMRQIHNIIYALALLSAILVPSYLISSDNITISPFTYSLISTMAQRPHSPIALLLQSRLDGNEFSDQDIIDAYKKYKNLESNTQYLPITRTLLLNILRDRPRLAKELD